MAIVLKTYRDGLDKVVNILQNKFYPRLLGFWDDSAVYTMYPRVNKNYKNDQLKPYLSLDNKDYKETLYDDKVSVNSFFIGDDVSEWEYSNQQIRREVSIVFQANLDALYSNTERIDEAFNNDVLRVLKQPNGYIVGDIQIAEGVDQVYNDFSITSEFKEKLKLDDIGKRHVVKFTFEVIYDLNCEKRVVKACADVTSSFNGSGISSTPSGGNKAVIVQTNEAIPVQTGTVINDTPSELRVEVNAAVATPRTYVRPRTTGQTVSYNAEGVIVSPDDPSPIRDSAYRVAKKSIVDPYDPPQFGEPMLPRVDKNWRLTQDNVFGHDFLFTGTSGGYYDPDTALYYDVDGVETTEALAFPNDLVVDHHTGFLWIRNAQGINNWETHLTDAYNTTVGGFSEFYVPSQTELDSLLNIGVTFGYSGFNPPFDFSTSNKVVSDTYLGNPTQQWYVSGISQRLTAPKGNNYRAMYFKPINPNTDL